MNVDHAGADGKQSYTSRIGVLRGVHFIEGEGLRGDVHFNTKHPAAEQLMWDAEHARGTSACRMTLKRERLAAATALRPSKKSAVSEVWTWLRTRPPSAGCGNRTRPPTLLTLCANCKGVQRPAQPSVFFSGLPKLAANNHKKREWKKDADSRKGPADNNGIAGRAHA